MTPSSTNCVMANAPSISPSMSIANQSGQQAAEQLAHRLGAHGILALRVLLPEGYDPNSFFVRGGRRATVPVSAGGCAAMKFRVIRQPAPSGAHSPIRVIEQNTGREVAWINRYPRPRVCPPSGRQSPCTATRTACCTSCAGGRAFITLAISLSKISPNRLCSITCASSPAGNLRLLPPPSTIASPAADRAIRNQFPDAPCQVAHGFHQPFLHRRPMGLGRPRFELSRLRVQGTQAQHRSALGR